MQIFSPIQIIQIQSFAMDAPGTFGTFAMPGVKAGDILISVEHITTGKPQVVGLNVTGQFRPVVTEDDVMQQNGGSTYADNEFIFRFLRLNQIS